MSYYSDSQLMMIFSAIAYEDKSAISQLIWQVSGQSWSVVWGPEETIDGANLAFVAQSVEGNEYALVNRGTNAEDPFSWALDFEASLVDWPYITGSPPSGNPQVSKGLMDALNNVLGLFDYDSGKRLTDFFKDISALSVFVTGHSLGGGHDPCGGELVARLFV